jgi:hypothetical protein
MKRTILLIIVILTLSACFLSKIETRTFRSYITSYMDIDQMELGISDAGSIMIGGRSEWICGWRSKGREKVLYDSLCILHNDMTYNKKREFMDPPGPDWGNGIFKGDIISIQVVSNAAFDDRHPAHSSLNDLIRFLSISLYPYFLSDYTPFDWEKNRPGNFQCEELLRIPSALNREDGMCYYPIDKNLSEIRPSDMVLADLLKSFRNSKGEYIGHQLAYLVFEQQPEANKEHELTVTITLSDGRVFAPKITKVFE